MPILPGNMSERLIELRNAKRLTQKELSKQLSKKGLGFFDHATISRAESGKTVRVNVELIEALSRFYGVTADFILGLTDVPDQKYYELRDLGLSYDAARRLVQKEINPDALNRLVNCDGFPLLCEMISAYFPASMMEAYKELDQMFCETRSLADHAKELGVDLSEQNTIRLGAVLRVLKDSTTMQKDAVMDQFDIVIQELIRAMYDQKEDPKPLVMSKHELAAAFYKKTQERQRHSGGKILSEEERAWIMSRIVAAKMNLREDEIEPFSKLFLLMLRNRSNAESS